MLIFGKDQESDKTNLERNFFREKGVIPQFVIQDWMDKCEEGLQEEVEEDFLRIRDYFFKNKPPVPNGAKIKGATPAEKKLYIATCGAPCSGKSTELDIEIIEGTDPRYRNLVMVDPDRYGMEYMFTYRTMLRAYDKSKLGFAEAARVAYNRARPGSNIITLLMLNKAFNGGYHIAHGTTMTGGAVGGLLENMGLKGYERRLLLCYAPDEVRVEAGERRIQSECHYQVDPDDFVGKGVAYPQRHEVYFTHGDHLRLMWKHAVGERAVCAAEYRGGVAIVHNEEAFDCYRNQYVFDAIKLASKGIEIPKWDSLESTYFARFNKSGALKP